MVRLNSISLQQQIARNLDRASSAVGRSLYRMSTGMRVNSPQDGVVDYNTITRLDSQMRGIYQGITNVNDAASLATTAETAINQLLTISYNLRELAQQARDSDLTSTEREELSDEASALLQDFNTYTQNVSYNSKNLLDNSLGTVSIQTGNSTGDTVSFTIGDARSTTLGRLAIYSGAQGSITNAIGTGNIIRFNGVYVNASVSDGVSTGKASYSAIAIANAINGQKEETNVQAEVLTTTRTITLDSGGQGNFASQQTLSAGEFTINGVSITGSSITSASVLVTKINAASSSTGVVASVDASGNIKLDAADGRNIQVVISNSATHNLYDWFNVSGNSTIFSAYATLSQNSDQTHTGAVRIWSSDQIIIQENTASTASISLGLTAGTKSLVSGTALDFINLSTTADADEAVKVLDATIAQISTLQAQVGAVHSRLDQSASFLVSDLTAKEEAKQSIGGADFALEMADLVMAQLLQDANIASLTQANVNRATVARLLENI